jgi:hypothetical protein
MVSKYANCLIIAFMSDWRLMIDGVIGTFTLLIDCYMFIWMVVQAGHAPLERGGAALCTWRAIRHASMVYISYMLSKIRSQDSWMGQYSTMLVILVAVEYDTGS